jgi:hypothetical protein
MTQQRGLNHTAYQGLKATINRTYPRGRFVALHGGQIVADAADFGELGAMLIAQGKNPAEALVVQAGVDYPETAVIFT